MMDDSPLLREYATNRSEAAFAELVRRHLDFVYSAALRQANGDTHLAEDAAQLVFTDLARKANALADRPVLAGWLFTSTRFAVAKLIRTEQRRRRREQEAQLMPENSNDDPTAALDWTQVRPVLDEALAGLTEPDREAVLLRFFGGCNFPEIGRRLRLSENAARMKVDRALDKLQAQLARRGLTSSTAALGAILASQAAIAAPAGLAASVTGSALAGASAAGAVGFFATLMTMNKVTASLAGLALAAGTTGFVLQARTNTALRAEIRQLRGANEEIPVLQQENLRLAREAAEVETMRSDDRTLAQLNEQADGLKDRMQVAMRAVSAQAQARAVSEPALEPRTLDRMPKARSYVRPVYPDDLKAAGVEGEVMVDFIVDTNGQVRNAYVAHSSERALEAGAVEAVSQWVFDPGQKGGRAVNTHMQVPVVFSLPKDDASVGEPRPVTQEKEKKP